MSRPPRIADPATVGVARHLAQAHADAGLELFNKLQCVAVESKAKPATGDYLRHVSFAVPAATCLSLAAEQFLKVIHFQHFGSYPQDHDLVVLVDALPREAQSALERRYAERYQLLQNLAVVHFGLVAGPDRDSVPVPSIPDFPALRAGLEHLRRVFRDWRYIYEAMDPTHNVGIHFKSLLVLIEACRAQVAGYPGNGRVTLGDVDAPLPGNPAVEV